MWYPAGQCYIVAYFLFFSYHTRYCQGILFKKEEIIVCVCVYVYRQCGEVEKEWASESVRRALVKLPSLSLLIGKWE